MQLKVDQNTLVASVQTLPIMESGVDQLYAVTFADGHVEPMTSEGISRSLLIYSTEALEDARRLGLKTRSQLDLAA